LTLHRGSFGLGKLGDLNVEFIEVEADENQVKIIGGHGHGTTFFQRQVTQVGALSKAIDDARERRNPGLANGQGQEYNTV
jgi:hypothetical protein